MPFTPLPLGWGLLDARRARLRLFFSPGKLTAEATQALEHASIEALSYEAFDQALAELRGAADTTRVGFDARRTPARIAQELEHHGHEAIAIEDPIALPRARKASASSAATSENAPNTLAMRAAMTACEA